MPAVQLPYQPQTAAPLPVQILVSRPGFQVISPGKAEATPDVHAAEARKTDVQPAPPAPQQPEKKVLKIVTISADTIDDGRQQALAEISEGSSGALKDAPIRSESFRDGQYTGIFEVPDHVAQVDLKSSSSARTARPAWVLVIPAEVRDTTAVWGRKSPWSRRWTVPASFEGIRYVSTMGDADDHDLLTPDKFLNLSTAGSAVGRIARKYGATHVAVSVFDNGDGSQATWLWSSGHWQELEQPDNGGGDLKINVEKMISQGSQTTQSDADPEPQGMQQASGKSGQPTVVLDSAVGAGDVSFTVRIPEQNSPTGKDFKERVFSMDGVRTTDIHLEGSDLVIKATWVMTGGSQALASALSALGLPLSR